MAKWMGTATEELSFHVGPGVGGLLNATFGNATELIIAIFALRAGLVDVVKASITGSIIGNLLFVLGLSLFLGGLLDARRQRPHVARGIQHPGRPVAPELVGGGAKDACAGCNSTLDLETLEPPAAAVGSGAC